MKTKPFKPIADHERIALARRAFEVAFHAFESFEMDNIGVDLAYLMGAICDRPNQESQVDWSRGIRPQKPELLRMLEAEFPESSPIWQFIIR